MFLCEWVGQVVIVLWMLIVRQALVADGSERRLFNTEAGSCWLQLTQVISPFVEST